MERLCGNVVVVGVVGAGGTIAGVVAVRTVLLLLGIVVAETAAVALNFCDDRRCDVVTMRVKGVKGWGKCAWMKAWMFVYVVR